MTILRTWEEVENWQGGPTQKERELADHCVAGVPYSLGDDCPTQPSADRTIRAEILRYLILGGCDAKPVAELGVIIIGAYIKGSIDLNFVKTDRPMQLRLCYLEGPLQSNQTRLRTH